MIDAFRISFRLRNTYKKNGVIYALKSMPLIKNLLPDALYKSPGLNRLAHAIAILWEVLAVFLGKALYVSVMIFLPLSVMKAFGPDAFLHMFLFLTVGGALMNTHMFNPTKDKYYAMMLMGMDARAYTLSNYLYFLARTALGMLPFLLLFGSIAGVRVGVLLALPIVVCAVKVIVAALGLYDARGGEKVRNENLPPASVWIVIGAVLVLAYLPPFLGYALSQNALYIVAGALVLLAVPCFIYIWRYKSYRAVYRALLTADAFAMNKSANQHVQSAYFKKIEADPTQGSDKTGYRYFNELFVKRHSKMLTRSAKRIALVLTILLIAAVAACLVAPQVKPGVNAALLNAFAFTLLVMYYINRGAPITAAMFMNCDHSMLTYSFYRQPKAILRLFAHRLRSIVIINLLPATVLALGLPALLYASGGTANSLDYFMIALSIYAMSAFFSVHVLVMYYLLQPYTLDLKAKGVTYQIVSSLTYMACYIVAQRNFSTMAFGLGVSAFCIAYVAVALALAYRLAPSTFRLRR